MRRAGLGELATAAALARFVDDRDARPAHALVEAAGDADLLAVGARARGDLGGLGSVAERVAHDAHCSVLVIRDA
jgi:nucleotide-binding universal stress UspA family protein